MPTKLLLIALPLMNSVWTTLASPPAAQESPNSLSWIWVLVVLLLLIPLVWWLLRSSSSPEAFQRSASGGVHLGVENADHTIPPPAPPDEEDADFGPATPQVYPATRSPQAVAIDSAPPDDLVIIEGIGPKISALLQANGINTFGQLATIDISRVEQLLQEAGFKNIANPATWPEQARLASEGKWDELKVLQAELKGGRRK